jgi:hypothetical protein
VAASRSSNVAAGALAFSQCPGVLKAVVAIDRSTALEATGRPARVSTIG